MRVVSPSMVGMRAHVSVRPVYLDRGWATSTKQKPEGPFALPMHCQRTSALLSIWNTVGGHASNDRTGENIEARSS